jgi:hypothetical protein
MTEYRFDGSDWYPGSIDKCTDIDKCKDEIIKLRKFKLDIVMYPSCEMRHALTGETEYESGVVDGYNKAKNEIENYIRSCFINYETSKVVMKCRRIIVPK